MGEPDEPTGEDQANDLPRGPERRRAKRIQGMTISAADFTNEERHHNWHLEALAEDKPEAPKPRKPSPE